MGTVTIWPCIGQTCVRHQLPPGVNSAIQARPTTRQFELHKERGIMRRLRNVKIVATLGAVSSDYKTIRALFEAGADVFRLT